MRKGLVAGLLALVFVLSYAGMAFAAGSPGLLRNKWGIDWSAGQGTDGDSSTYLYMGPGAKITYSLGGSHRIDSIYKESSGGVEFAFLDASQAELNRATPNVNGAVYTLASPVDGVYYVQVRNIMGANNSVYEVDVYGQNTADTSAPDAPTEVVASAGTEQVTLSWSPSTSGDVEAYRVYRDGVQIAELTGTSYTDTGLVGGQTYTYIVSAVDTSGNESQPSESVTATPIAPTLPPDPPLNLVGDSRDREVDLRWSPPQGGNVNTYRIYRDGALVATTTATNWIDSGLIPETTYQYAVSAVNSAGESQQVTLEITTLPPGPLDGVQSDLSRVGQSAVGALRVMLPFFLMSAGIILAIVILDRGLTWLAGKRLARR